MSEYKEDARVPYVSREDFPTDQIGIYNHILETRKLEYIFSKVGPFLLTQLAVAECRQKTMATTATGTASNKNNTKYLKTKSKQEQTTQY